LSYSHKCLINISDSVPEFGASIGLISRYKTRRYSNIWKLLAISAYHSIRRILDSVPEFGANMAQVTLGKFFSGVPQIREPDGDSKKNI
jgi:hypothetical protein